MRTRDAAAAVFYGQQVRDCGCGCSSACLGTAVHVAARDAALNSLYKSGKSVNSGFLGRTAMTKDAWSEAAREAAARARKMHSHSPHGPTAEGMNAEQHQAHADFHKAREKQLLSKKSKTWVVAPSAREGADESDLATRHNHAAKHHSEAAEHLQAWRKSEAESSASAAVKAKSHSSMRAKTERIDGEG